jgi:di/tricarboxylate transporter
VVSAGSRLVGSTVRAADLGRRFDLNLLGILRDGVAAEPMADDGLGAGDVLLVEGSLDALLRAQHAGDLEIRHQGPDESPDVREIELLEVLVMPRSELVGRTLSETLFRQRIGTSVVALHRQGETFVERISRTRIAVGDILVLQARRDTAERISSQRGLLHLGLQTFDRPPQRARRVAIGIFALVVLFAATGILGLATSVLLGCLALLLTRCVTPEEAYRSVEWRLVVLIAGMVAYGVAMEKTGAAELIASQIEALVHAFGQGLGPRAVLAGFYGFTLLLTQPMSNQAAALVVFPVAMKVALQTGVDPRAMAVTVALAASSSFLTPLEPSCLLVYGPGGYRFADYPRLGAGLSLLCLIVTLALVPVFWPS